MYMIYPNRRRTCVSRLDKVRIPAPNHKVFGIDLSLGKEVCADACRSSKTSMSLKSQRLLNEPHGLSARVNSTVTALRNTSETCNNTGLVSLCQSPPSLIADATN